MKKIILLLVAFLTFSQHAFAAENNSTFNFTLPDQKWALGINLDGFTTAQGETLQDNGKFRMSAFQKDFYVWNVGVIGMITNKKSNIEDMRDFMLKGAQNDTNEEISAVKMEDRTNMKTLEYFVDKRDGEKIHEKQIQAFLEVPRGAVEVVITKKNYSASDDSTFNKLIDSLKLKKPYQQTAMDHAGFGSYYFLQKDYAKAIKYYNKAISLEKRKPTLEKNEWRVVVDNLGMAYGITKKYTLVQRTYDYGLKLDPEYPMFFYNLACLYAETNKPDKALEYLGKAYEYRANMIPGEKFSDIRKDSSFQTLLNNPKFEELAKQFDKIGK